MNIPILYLVSFLDAFAFVLVITTMNPYVHSIGGTQFYLGILSSVASFINLIWNPIIGSLSDTLGRKTVLLQCVFICLVGNVLSALSSSLTVFFIARILTTFGTQIGVLLKSLVDDNLPTQESKMAAINRMQAIGGSCFIFASLVSGYLSELENGFTYIFCLISGVFLMNLGNWDFAKSGETKPRRIAATLLSLLKDKKSKSAQPTSFDFLSELKKATTNLSKVDWPKYWDLFTIKLIVDYVLTVFHFTMPEILMNRFGIKGKSFGYVFASVSIIGISTTLALNRLKKLFYRDDTSGLRRLLHGCLVLICAFLGLSWDPTFTTFFIFLAFIVGGRVIFDSTFTEVILARAGVHEKGSIMGTFETTLALGGLTAPLITGVVSDKWGTDTSLLICVVPLIAGTLVAYSQRHNETKTK